MMFEHEGSKPNEEEHLLSPSQQWTSMADLKPAQEAKSPTRIEGAYADDSRNGTSGTDFSRQVLTEESQSIVEYKVYKRRWFGLVQLVLLNIIGSWGVRIERLRVVKVVDG